MPTRFSVRVATILGFPVRVHLLLPVVALFFVFTTRGYVQRPVLLGVLGFLGILLLSTVAHEMGHALVARRNRLRVHGIVIWPLGGVTYHSPERSPGARLRVSLAGVAVNLAIALLAGAAIWIRDGAPPGLPRLAWDRDLLVTAWNLNLALLLLNLLPGVPFDGGHALEALLWKRFGRSKARFVVLCSGLIVAVALLAGGVLEGDMWMGAVGLWALGQVTTGYREFRERGVEDEAFLGVYDFSEGYTSLDESGPPPERPQRKKEREREKARRAEEKRVAADREAEESAQRRLDRLLERIAAEGMGGLSSEERVFLDEESRRLRARNRGRSPTRP